MNLLKFFQTKSRLFYFFIALLGMVSSLTNIGMLMFINTALGGRTPFAGRYNFGVYLGLMLVSFLVSRFFQHYMVDLTNDIMFRLEISIVQKVRNASFESFEKLGYERIYAALSDTRVLGRLPQIFVTLINASVTVLCSLCYLFWIAPVGGCIVTVLMVSLLLVYLARDRKIARDLNEVRDLQDSYYDSLRELMNGFKQIRISVLRNNNLFNKFIFFNRNRARNLTVNTSKQYVANELIGSYSWYFVLGVIIFVLPVFFKLNVAQVATFVATVLFMTAPVSQLVTFFPFYTAFRIALERINQIDARLEIDAVPVATSNPPSRTFNTIRFEDIVYKYDINDQQSFRLELPDLTINGEEIIFVTGGNGSGKTTFINILTGLCRPQKGRIYIDEKEVGWEEFNEFSNSMAVVYTNHHLFRENYDDHELSAHNSHLGMFSKMLHLDNVLKLAEEKNWVDTNLSKGQQKRLALMLALMENKPFLVLDEWAAEQDPFNRRTFYTQWLPAIKASGKTIIAITHDDDYYHLADRVIKFNYGKIASDVQQIQENV